MIPPAKLDPVPSVVVFDYNWGGHIPAYHRLIVESLLRVGWRVISLTGGNSEVTAHIDRVLPAARERLFAPHCPELGRPPARKAKLAFLSRIPGGFALWSRIRTNPRLRTRHARMRWDACRSAVERIRQFWDSRTLLFLPYLDDMLEPDLSPESVRIPLPWAGLYMSASDLRDPDLRTDIERRLRFLSHPQCRGVAILDEACVNPLENQLPHLAVSTLPDIADDSLVASSKLSEELERRAAGRKIVGLLGHLSEAKNLAMFLDLATAPRNRDIFFLLAGQYEALSVAPRERALLTDAAAGAMENVWALPNRIAAESEFNFLLQRVDVVFAVYRDFTRSSNILTKAALFHRPIVVAPGFCMAERVNRYRLGLTAKPDDAAECDAALRRLLRDGARGADYDGYARDFSPLAFQSRLVDFLAACATASPPAQPQW